MVAFLRLCSDVRLAVQSTGLVAAGVQGRSRTFRGLLNLGDHTAVLAVRHHLLQKNPFPSDTKMNASSAIFSATLDAGWRHEETQTGNSQTRLPADGGRVTACRDRFNRPGVLSPVLAAESPFI